MESAALIDPTVDTIRCEVPLLLQQVTALDFHEKEWQFNRDLAIASQESGLFAINFLCYEALKRLN